MKKIKLTQGKYALVDDEDYDYLMQWKWCAHKPRNTYYVVRESRKGEFEKRKLIRMHRVVAERAGLDMSHQIDHVDQNGLNNQRNNLRSATNKQNCENKGLQFNNTSGVKGVSWHKTAKKWRARIMHNNKNIHLGLFANLEDAKQARLEAERKYWTHGQAD